MWRVDGFSCCKIVLFSTASNCWSRLFGCFTNIRTWQLALLREHSYLAMHAASQTFALFKLPVSARKALVRQEGHREVWHPLICEKAVIQWLRLVIFLLLPNNTYQWRFRVQQRTIKVAVNNSSHCTTAAGYLPSQQCQAPEHACITFSQISKPYLWPADKNLGVFFLLFNALQSWHAATTR